MIFEVTSRLSQWETHHVIQYLIQSGNWHYSLWAWDSGQGRTEWVSKHYRQPDRVTRA